MRKLTAALLVLLLAAFFTSALDSRRAIAQDIVDPLGFLANLFANSWPSTKTPAERERLRKLGLTGYEEENLFFQASGLINAGCEEAKEALRRNDKAHFDKWLRFLKNVRDRRYKDETLKAYYHLAAWCLEQLPEHFESNVGYVYPNGEVAKDPDPNVQFQLHREGNTAATAAGVD